MKKNATSIFFSIALTLAASSVWSAPGATGSWKIWEAPPQCDGMAAPDEFVATAIDSAGNVVAVSAFGIIGKYSPTGSRLWIQRLNSGSVSIYACDEGEQRLAWVPTDVVIDEADNIYVLGLKKHDPDTNDWVNRLFLMKIAADGTTRWTQELATYDRGADLGSLPPATRPKMRLWTPDAGGTYLVIGSGLAGRSGLFCFDLAGNLVWHKDDGSPTGPFDLDGRTLFKAHLVEYPADTGEYVLDTAIDVCPVTPQPGNDPLACTRVTIATPEGMPTPDRLVNEGDLIASAHTGRADKIFLLSSADYDGYDTHDGMFALASIAYNPGTGAYEAAKSLFMSRGQAFIYGDFGTGLALTPQGNLWMTGSWTYDPLGIGASHTYLAKVNPDARLLAQYDYGHEKLTFSWAAANEVATDRNGTPVIAGYDQDPDHDGDYRLFLASDVNVLDIYHYVRPTYQVSIFDPVSPATGNYAETAVDINYPTAGIPLALVRSYASRFSDQNGRLGYGWRLTLLDMHIEGDPTEIDKARVVWGDGHAEEYINSGKETSGGVTTVQFSRLGPVENPIVLTGHQDGGGKSFRLWNPKLNRTIVFAQAQGRHWYPTSLFKGLDETAPGAFPLHFAYAADQIVVEDVASGRLITFTLDGERVIQARGSAGEVVQYQYDAEGNLVQVTRPDGSVIRYAYDTAHRLTRIEQRGARLLENAYDDQGRVVEQTDAQGQVTRFAYDPQARTTQVTSPDGLVTTYTYDRDYRLTHVSDGSGHSKSFTYDEAGHVTGVTLPDGSTLAYAYDQAGHLVAKTDAAGNTTSYTYDDEGHVVSVRRPGGETLAFGYSGGRFSSWTNPLGGSYTLTYNDIDKPTSLTDPVGRSVEYRYDAQGLIAGKAGRDGRTVSYRRDAAGRVMEKRIDDGAETLTYRYDALGRLTSVSGPSGTVAYSYDGRGRKASETGIFGQTVTYGYDGTRLQSVAVGGFAVTTERDAMGRPTRVADSFGHAIDYRYDGQKRLTTIEGPAGVSIAYHYGPSGLVDAISYRKDEAAFRTLGLTRGPGGRITAVDDDGPAPDRPLIDLALLCDAMDHIQGADYDPAGRLLGHGDRTAAYDRHGRLTDTSRGGHQSLFGYDPQGRRVLITEDGVEKRLVYAGAAPLMALDAAGNPTAYFLFGPGMGLVLGADGGLQYLLLSDYRKNVIAVLDGAGQIVAQRLYSPYGLVMAEAGAWPVPFGFLGESGLITETTGLVLTRSRAYDPETGRFLTPDPQRPTPALPASFNRYAYAHGDPLNLTDTSGRSPFGRPPFWLIPYVNMLPTLRPTDGLDGVALAPLGSFGSDLSPGSAAHLVADANPIYSDRASDNGGGNPQVAPPQPDADGLVASFFTLASSSGESEPPPGQPVAQAPGTGYVAGISTVPIIALI